VVQPAGLRGQPVRALDAATGPAPGLGDAAAAEGSQAELAQRVSDPLAPRAATPTGKLGGFPGPAAVLDHQGQGLGEADLPARIDVNRRAGPRPRAHEVHAAEQRLLFDERGRTTGAFHGAHTTAGG